MTVDSSSIRIPRSDARVTAERMLQNVVIDQLTLIHLVIIWITRYFSG